MAESEGATAMADGGRRDGEMDQPMSPLEPNDLHRQSMQNQQHWSPANQPQTGNNNNVASPASVESAGGQRFAGNFDMNSPFHRPASQQQQSFDFNPPRTPMFSGSPTKVPHQQQIMSPVGPSPQQAMPPASPFQRSSSAASNSAACPSPYPNANAGPPPPYSGGPPPPNTQMYAGGGYPPANVRMPPSYPPNGQQQMPYGQYPPNAQWQQMHPHYQQRVMGPRMVGRVVYNMPQGQGYPPGAMPPQAHMMYPRAMPRQGMVQYQGGIPNGAPNTPRTPTYSQQPQQIPSTSVSGSGGSSAGTPTPSGTPTSVPMGTSPFGYAAGSTHPQNAMNAQQQYYIQQQRMQQQQSTGRPRSPIRSPYVNSNGQQTPQPQMQVAAPPNPGTPNSALQARFGPQSQSQSSRGSTPQQSATPTSASYPPNGVVAAQPDDSKRVAAEMRSPPLMQPAQAQIPPSQHQILRPHPPLQHHNSMDMSGRVPMLPGQHMGAPGAVPSGAPSNAAPPPSAAAAAASSQMPHHGALAPPHPIPQHPSAAIVQHHMMGGAPRLVHPMAPNGVPPNVVRMPPQMRLFSGQVSKQIISPDVFLTGCVFYIDETLLQEPHELYTQIRFHGGEIETSLTAVEPIVTHVVCDTFSRRFHELLKLPIRLVTLQWLNDALEHRKMESPVKASHLPCAWGDAQLPGAGKIIACEGFNEMEEDAIRALCKGIGARFNNEFSSQHASLISKTLVSTSLSIVFSGDGPKAQKAQEWNIPILNYLWLVRLYFGNMRVISEINLDVHRPPSDPQSGNVMINSFALERITDICIKFMAAWHYPIMVSDESVSRAVSLRQQMESDLNCLPHKKFRITRPPPNEEQISKANQILTDAERLPDVRIYIEGLPTDIVEQLGAKIRFLGGRLVNNVASCSHFVAPTLKRTVSLCEALARGRTIAEPSWIEHSFNSVNFVDPYDFHINDMENERKFGFSALNTVYRARQRQIFEDMTFHLSPNVQPSFAVLRRLIEAGGGTVERQKPRLKWIAEAIQYDKTFLIVLNDNDACDYQYLFAHRIPLFNEEFILMSIIRHRIDTESPLFRLNPPIDEPHQTTAPQTTPVRQNRVKAA